jgi:hypothetical protein
MTRMFKSITRTWNVFVGCKFDCIYCSAKKAALTRWKHVPRYTGGFQPHFVPSELSKSFKPGEFIFVAYMGDIAWAAPGEVTRILQVIWSHPQTRFLFCTKNPKIYSVWPQHLPPNITLGTTIETNRNYLFSLAPIPVLRYFDFISASHPHKFLSIEPVIDFDTDVLVTWANDIGPDIIEVGADNYHNHLPEPSPEKLEELLIRLRNICPQVIEKDGLDRLKGE